MEREAAEGSEATTEASNRPTSVTPNLDSRFSRSISIGRSEENSGSKTGGGPMISPLVPLEQLLQQEEFSGGQYQMFKFLKSRGQLTLYNFLSLCSIKMSREMLQNLSYFWNKKTQIIFFTVTKPK